jgi:flagellar biosynthesis/type III secretory pathway protein FliH
LLSDSTNEASKNASQTWTAISANHFVLFKELNDDFDGLKDSPNSQNSSAKNAARQKELNDRFEQEQLAHKQIELIKFTGRLNELQEKYINEIRDQEEELAQRLLDLAIRLAEKVVRTHFAVDKAALLPLVEEALAQLLPGDGNVKLSIHPDDAELISKTFNDRLTQGRITFVADAGLLPGSCQVQSDYSLIDNSLMMRWEQMIRETGLSERTYE